MRFEVRQKANELNAEANLRAFAKIANQAGDIVGDSKILKWLLKNLMWRRQNRLIWSVVQVAVIMAIGFFIGGSAPYVLTGVVFSEALCAFQSGWLRVCRLAKSPFSYAGGKADHGMNWAITKWRSHMKKKPVWKLQSNIAELMSAGVFAIWGACLWYWHVLFDVQVMRVVVQSLLNSPPIDVNDLRKFLPLESYMYVVTETMQITASISYDGFSAVLIALLGIPQCEGVTKIVGACGMLGITLALVRILNYDAFGLVASANYCVQTTRPHVQGMLVSTLLWFARTIMFVLNQVMCLCFLRMLTLADPTPSDAQWTCPWRETFTVVIGKILVILICVVALVILLVLSANGHLMGQDYLVVGMGKKMMGIDLQDLDPDGDDMIRFEKKVVQLKGDEAGLFRRRRRTLRKAWINFKVDVLGYMPPEEPTQEELDDEDPVIPGVDPLPVTLTFNIYLAMLPTASGVWFDTWNVSGFLIKERAQIYAEQFGVTKPCDVCGEIHVPYDRIMSATAKQVGLTWQMLPLGIVVGKASEYFNSPPLYYNGQKLKCLHGRPVELDPGFYKATGGGPIRVFFTYFVLFGAFFQEVGSRALQKLCSVLLYGVVITGAFVFNPIPEETESETVKAISASLFYFCFLVCLVKTGSARVLPAMFGYFHVIIAKARDVQVDPKPVTSEETVKKDPKGRWRVAQLMYGQQLPLGLGVLAPISAWYAMPIAAVLSVVVSDLHLRSFVKIEAYRNPTPGHEGHKVYSLSSRLTLEALLVAFHVVPVGFLAAGNDNGGLASLLMCLLGHLFCLVLTHHLVLAGVRVDRSGPLHWRDKLGGRVGTVIGVFTGTAIGRLIDIAVPKSVWTTPAALILFGQVGALFVGLFVSAIINLVKDDVPVLIAFFGAGAVCLLIDLPFRTEEGSGLGVWWFIPNCIGLASGLTMGALLEWLNLRHILKDGNEDAKSPTSHRSPKDAGSPLALEDVDSPKFGAIENPSTASGSGSPKRLKGASSPGDPATPLALEDEASPKSGKKPRKAKARGDEFDPNESALVPSPDKRRNTDMVFDIYHDRAKASWANYGKDGITPEDVTPMDTLELASALQLSTLPSEPRFPGDTLSLQHVPEDEQLSVTALARRGVLEAIDMRPPVPELTDRTPAYSLLRNAEQGKVATANLELATLKAQGKIERPEIPELQMQVVEEERELRESRYKNWKQEESVITANLMKPKGAPQGPPPEQPPKKTLAGIVSHFHEVEAYKAKKVSIDPNQKRPDPDEVLAERQRHLAFD